MISGIILLALAPVYPAQKPESVQAQPAGTEITAALEVADRKNQRVLLVWGESASERSQQLDALFRDDPELALKLLYEYRIVRLKAEEIDSYSVLARKYGVILEKDAPHLTILAADGRVLANEPAARIMEEGQIAAKKLMILLEKHQAPYKDAKALLDAALVKSEAQLKRVFLVFETPACTACHDLEARMRLPEVLALLDKEFIVCAVDLERTIGGKELQEFVSGGRQTATPWYAVLQPDKTQVVDCDDLTGKHLGCPKTEEELEAWSGFLKRARQYLTDEEVGHIVAAFRKVQ